MQPGISKSIKILANEDSFIAIHKPPGIPFQKVDDQPGILELIRQNSQLSELIGKARLYPVHRLDKVTSGILVFAKGRKAANELSNHFRYKRIEKVYLALSDRKPKKKQGLIIGDMEKGRRSGYILTRTRNNPAITRFLSVPIPGRRPGLRLFYLLPKTGKTHQIRVAMKSIGSPVLGDPLYGRFDLARAEDRTYLHAWAIRFSIADRQFSIINPPGPGTEFSSHSIKKLIQTIKDPFAILK